MALTRKRIVQGLLCVLTSLLFVTIAAYADDLFSGKWKGEVSGGCIGGGGFGGGRGGAGGGGGRGGGGRFFVEPAQRGGGGGIGGAGGAGGRGGPAGARGGGGQQFTMNIKAKEDKKAGTIKVTGNVAIAAAGGSPNTDDIHDGKIEGNKITFTTGKSPNPVCQYSGELDPETKELKMTRALAGSTAQGATFTLKK